MRAASTTASPTPTATATSMGRDAEEPQG
jgi:hypothetical protein